MPLPRSASFLVALVTFLLVAAVLWVGRALLIPIALAILITFLLAPAVTRVQRLGMPRVLSVLVVVSLVGAALGGVGWVISAQVYDLAQELPKRKAQIEENLSQAIRYVVGPPHGESLEDSEKSITSLVSEVKKDVQQQIKESTGESGSVSPLDLGPIPVRVVDDAMFPDTLTAILASSLSPLARAGLVVVLVLFMLVKREDLRNRIVTLSGRSNLAVTTQALDDAARRISRYLLAQFLINVAYGICAAVGLYFIGVDYAALWGVCAAILRYVPYVGPWIAATLPIAYSLLTSPTWLTALFVIGLIIVLELIVNNLAEPMFYGRGVGISSVAVILGVMFWGWLWGGMGLVLATPLTTCLVVAGRYVPCLSLFHRFLSDDPGLEMHFVYYQRLLARDEDEAQEIFDDFAQENSLVEACGEIVAPALRLLKNDRLRGAISHDQAAFMLETIEEHLAEVPVEAAESGDAKTDEKGTLFLGYGVHDPEDEQAAALMARLLARDPCRFEILPNEVLSSEVLERIQDARPVAICLFSLPPGGMTRARHLCKRLRVRFPELRIILARWGGALSEKQIAALHALGVGVPGRTPAETRDQLRALVGLRRLVPDEETGKRPTEEKENVAATPG